VNADATDVAVVVEDVLVVLVVVWWWVVVPLGWLLVLVLTPWVLVGGGSAYFASGFADPEDDLRAHREAGLPLVIGLEYGLVGATGTSRVAKQLPARLGVGGRTMKTLVIGLGTLLLVAASRPALAQRCLSFRPSAFFAGAVVAPGYPYPAYGYPVYPYPLPPAPSLGFGRGGIYGHVFVGRGETVTSYTFPGRDSWQ